MTGCSPAPPFPSARFLLSAAALRQAPADCGAEVAFAGRSNAGKSSAINAVVGINRLARTSKTPGRTQQLNFFSLGDAWCLVDLPGYGYARVPEPVKARWQALLQLYLQRRQSLRGLVLVMDVRHPLTPLDRSMVAFCRDAGLSMHILLTKADKLGRGAATDAMRRVSRELGVGPSTGVQLFSARIGTGVDEARARLRSWLGCGGDGHRGLANDKDEE